MDKVNQYDSKKLMTELNNRRQNPSTKIDFPETVEVSWSSVARRIKSQYSCFLEEKTTTHEEDDVCNEHSPS